MRHDEPNRLFQSLCKEAQLRDIENEPKLQTLEGEHLDLKTANRSDKARADTRVRGFWGNRQNAFFDFRVINPFASSHSNKIPQALYKGESKKKKREYEQRVRLLEDGTFTPMIMLSTGGTGPEMTAAIKLLASRIALKKKEQYAHVINLIRCRFAFAMMRSALICLRGSRGRSPKGFNDHNEPSILTRIARI